MPPETRSQKRKAELTSSELRRRRAYSDSSAVCDRLSRAVQSSSLASIALSAGDRVLEWDSISLILRGNRPPTGASRQSTMNPPDSLSRPNSAVSRQSGTISPRPPSGHLAPPQSSRPVAGSRPGSEVRPSQVDSDWPRPPQLYVTEARLSQVASELSSAMELGLTRASDAMASRIGNYIKSMEGRVIDQVIETVSAEYNSIAVTNVERNAALRNELARLTQTVNGNSERLTQTMEQLGQALNVSERTSLAVDELGIRFGQWQSIDDVVALVRTELNATAISQSEAIRAELQAEVHQLAESIRVLSLRLGSMSQLPGAHSGTGNEAQKTSRLPVSEPPRLQDRARVNLSSHPAVAEDPFSLRPPPSNPGGCNPDGVRQIPFVNPGSLGPGFHTSRPPLIELPTGRISLGGRRTSRIPVPTNCTSPRGNDASRRDPLPSSRPLPNLPETPPLGVGRQEAGRGQDSISPPPGDRGGGHFHRSSSSSSGTTACALRLDRLKRKIRLTCDLMISTMNIDPTLVSTKAQAIEVVNYDLPQLLGLKATLRECERAWEKFDDLDEELADFVDTTSQKALGWERALVDLQKRFYMHLRPNASLLKRVDLLPFTGSPDSETVFQFLDTFHRLADMSCDPSEQADLMYNSYLSPEIQMEVFSFKTDIKRIETWLVSQYGDLRRLADLRVARVASMKHPSSAQPPSAHIEYFKSVHQLLIHLESLSQSDRVDQQEIANIIFNASWVTQLVSRLPEESIVAFTKLLEREPRIPPPSGRRHFELLRDLIDSTWRQLITAQRIRTARDPGSALDSRKPAAPRSAHSAGPKTPVASQAPLSPKAPGKAPGKRSATMCPFHDPGVPARHSIGQCYSFFKATSQQRFELCKKARACFTCLSTDCIRVSPGGCITSQLPAELICGDCAQGKSRRPLNVLLCSNTAHSRPPLKTVQDALMRFLKPFDMKLGDHLKSQFNLASAAGRVQGMGTSASRGPSKSSPVDHSQKVPAFDTVSGSSGCSPKTVKRESAEDTVYIFQLVKLGRQTALVFYDSGATGNLVRGEFAEAAGFKVLDTNSQLVGALGSTTMWTKYGTYTAMLGDNSSGNFHHLLFQGIDQITTAFPRYDLHPMVDEVKASGRLDSNESFPQYVGGRQTDILIGLKSSELQPTLLFTLPSGLGVYRCHLRDCWGSNIAFGGPHELISAVNKKFFGFSVSHLSVLLTQLRPSILDISWPLSGTSFSPSSLPLCLPLTDKQSIRFDATPVSGSDALSCGLAHTHSLATLEVVHKPECVGREAHIDCSPRTNPPPLITKAKIPLSKIRQLMDGDAEPVVSYRCPKCEECQDCKASPTLKTSSLRERAEQKLIEASVRIDYAARKTFVKYPFLSDPVVFFTKHYDGRDSNLGQARVVYFQQCRKKEVEKQGMREEMQKLIDAGFITPLSELSQGTQDLISSAPIKHFFPWRSVQKADSISTPTRLVVDPSMSLLNLNVAKGDPQLASMFSILLRSRSNPCLWSADIKKLYNMLILEPECLPYSLFLYNPSLDPCEEPLTFVLLRAWYGTASTSGQATYALRQLGLDHADSHPLGSKVLLNDIYVDDLLRATLSRDHSEREVAEVQEILANGGMALKFVCFSQESPPEVASHDLESMTTLGYKYFPENDLLALNLGEINFKRKIRGAKLPNLTPCDTPEAIEEAMTALPQLTRRHVVAKSAEIFDPMGLFEPYKAMLKRALSNLNGLEWDDPVPEADHEFWRTQLKLWPALAELRINRSTIPPNAIVPLQVRLICNTDASTMCAGASIYLSCKLHSGEWSSQLLTAKSRLTNYTVPRNELEAIVLGSELTFAVIISLRLPIRSVLIASDSLVAISWAMNEKARNKTFVFNRVLTVQRYLRWIREVTGLTDEVELVHVPGELNAADCLTKGLIHPRDVSGSSPWQLGQEWMRRDVHLMPLTRYEDISLSTEDVTKFLSETISDDAMLASTAQGATYFCLYPTMTSFGETTACVVNPAISNPAPPPPSSFCFSAFFGEGTHSMLERENAEFKKISPGLTHLLNPIRLGWGRSNRVLSRVVEILLKMFHNAHLNSANQGVRNSLGARCPYCILSRELLQKSPGDQTSICGPFVRQSEPLSTSESARLQVLESASQTILDYYWDSRSTLLCKTRISSKELHQYEEDPTRGLLFYKGRLAQDSKVAVLDLEFLDLAFLDGHEITFCNPCIMPDSVIFYAYAMWVHLKSAPHMGLESTLVEIMKRFHPIRPRRILGKMLGDCVKCKAVRRKVLEHEMAKHKAPRLTLAPPFTFCMGDLAQDFWTKSRFTGRQSMRAPALVLCCLLSGATAIYMLEDWSTQSVMHALERHGCRYGFPSQLYVDSGSQLKKLASVTYSIVDLATSLRAKFCCDIVVAPPKSHSSQGRVERRIGLIKTALSKLAEAGFLLSFLGWECLFSRIANDLNNLPISRASSTGTTRPEWSVLTPNRLLLGRNNKRSMVGPLVVDATPSVCFERMQEAQEEWYKLFMKQIHLFVPSPKWFHSDSVQQGDVVLFFLGTHMKATGTVWHYGLVTSVSGLTLTIEYTVPPSNTKKSLTRGMRDVVRIAHETELDFNSEAHALRICSQPVTLSSDSSTRQPSLFGFFTFSPFVSAMLVASDACARAKAHHAAVRQRDAANVLSISPLLASRDLTPLPSSAEAGRVSRNICGDRSRHHQTRDIQNRYMEYHQQVAPGCYAPPLPRTHRPPLPDSCLPGGVAVLDHIQALVESQNSAQSGGSFLPFISGTLDLCSTHRQPSANLPRVRTLIFPTSSDTEIASFVRDFNALIADSLAPASGFMPHSLYHFDVENVSSYPECPFKIIPQGREEVHIWKSNQPARIHFGFYSTRFEIVIPWTSVHLSSDHRGAFSLRVPSLRVSDMWHTLFSKLRGTAIGIGLNSDIEMLSEFWANFFPRDRYGPILLKTAELEVLLAFAGYNSTKTNITALNFFFTGGFIVKHWEIRCGFGRWGSTLPLPPTLDLYLQSEAIGVLNTALVCLCSILLHWFVTPGIAAVVSRKTPDKFLGWFARFWSCVLGSYAVPTADQFSNSEDRTTTPRRMLQSLVATRGNDAVFSVTSLADCFPPWRNVTGGGSPSDQLTLDHLLTTVWPLLSGNQVPTHLRWESNFQLVSGFLSGRPVPSARQWSRRSLGCHPDSSLLEVPLCLPPAEGFLAPLRNQLREFRCSLPGEDPLKSLSLAQLLLSFVWQHPETAFQMFENQASQRRKHFKQRDFDLIRPLVIAYFPEAARVDGPAAYLRFKADRTTRGKERTLQALLTRLRDSPTAVERVRLRRKIRNLRRTISRLEGAAPADAVASPPETRYDPASPTMTASPASPTPEEAEPEIEEERRIVYRETTPTPAPDDELIISTADWDQL